MTDINPKIAAFGRPSRQLAARRCHLLLRGEHLTDGVFPAAAILRTASASKARPGRQRGRDPALCSLKSPPSHEQERQRRHEASRSAARLGFDRGRRG